MDTPGTYRPRVVDVAIDALLRTMGAVLIEGPKWCGKTWTGLRHARSVVWVADPADNYLTRRIAHSDPASLLNGDKPLLLDEWQDAPGLWDAVRSSVDASGGAAGHYLLTGSATPRDTATSHSGTGRIARVRMWPMSLWESGLSDGSVSLGELLDGQPPRVARGSMTEAAMIEAILVGGWPGSLARPAADVLGVPRAYLESVAASDASRLDGARRDPVRLGAVIASLARNTATLVSTRTIAQDTASGGNATASTKTVADYLDVLRRLHILQEIPAWSPALRSPARLRQTPKRLLVDPSLAAAGMFATAPALRADRKTLGLLFETLCLRDLSVYAPTANARVSYYHDDAGLEADAILHSDDGRWSGIEIKWGPDQEDAAAASLLRLKTKMTLRGERPPSALVVIVGPGGFAHRRDDGVDVVPIDCLRP